MIEKIYLTQQFYLNIAHKSYLRRLNKNISSYTKWILATTAWLPIEFMGKKVAPDKCCLSKTITNDFSPFVEKTNVSIASISEKLELPESTIENYLIFLGVHRDISSFSIGTLYSLLSALPVSDKTGNAARKIYREIISNFDQNKIDINHEAYIAFINSGKIYCQKGNESGYFSVKEAYYLPTKTYGTNILKLFPIALIDGKQGPDKIEKLFGVKRLKDINFNIVGEAIVNNLNDEFQNEIERFKALVYVLRMNKDTKHEIANRLKKLKIVLSQELQTNFTHNNESTPFELEPYEYIYYKKRNCFFISTPNNLTSIEQLRESNKFCQSIAEIFSSLIETEEFSDFIHDLYGKQEISREPRLLYLLQKEDNSDIIESKKQLNIIDEARLSFWRAFSFASAGSIRTEIRNEKELIDFLRKKLKFNVEKIEKYSCVQIFNELSELSIQKCFYDLFLEFDIDYKSFTRHFSGLNFNELFKNEFEDLKLAYRNDFACQTFEVLSFRPLQEKEKYFDRIDDYSYLRYDPEIGFLENIEKTFADIVESEFSIKLNNKENNFSFERKIKENITKLEDKLILIPNLLMEKRTFQAHLLFNEEGEIIKQISIYNNAKKNTNTNPNIKQINVRGSTIEYDNYQSLAQKVLQGLNIAKIKLKPGRTISIQEQGGASNYKGKNKSRNVMFNNKNEEQIGFIAELLCYHKLIEKYGDENVNWVSENAYRAYPDKFVTGEAGKGFDLELTENSKVRYIEIKGTSNIGGGIHMSKEEIKIALEFPEKYDLLIVEDPLSNEPFIRHIKMPFKFKRDESLFSNDKLKVFNDNYIIKFKWDSE